ncbi:hypothetical protein ACLOJK_036102 [Asimina triloba]
MAQYGYQDAYKASATVESYSLALSVFAMLKVREYVGMFLPRALALATGVLVAGGTAAYVQSRLRKRHVQPDSLNHGITPIGDNKERRIRPRKGRLRSLQILAAILLSHMGRMGAQNLLALVGIVVLRTALSNRLAKVQGLLFRAAFLRRIPAFNMAYYKISHVDGRITNPEQRIASDIPRFCSELSDLVQEDLAAVADGLLYTWRFFLMVLVLFQAYVTGAGSMIGNFSPSFGKLMSKEQQLEGEYRQLHSRLRTHAESVAFYGGEKREASHIKQKFRTLIRHMKLVHHDHWWFGMIQDFLLKYLGATVGVVLIIEPFFSGNLRPDSSTMGRAEMLSNLRYHTSVIIYLFQSLGTLSISSRRLNRLSGYADRIHELMAVSRELSAVHDTTSQNNASRNYLSEANYIEFSGVKVVTPTGNVLVDNLSLKVESGSNLLITGPNGSGKSSLFRVLGGLWPLVSGSIVKPGIGSDLNKEIFYVPQRPYMAVGTLRDQLIYPLTANLETEPLTYNGMVELLKNVDLEYLLERYPLDKEINWGDELSLGEQQRLGMARLFYHKPKFAILDECTSAVTTDMEERFCAKVRAMGTSCITISHRPALVAFHDMILSLDGEGRWSVHRREDSLLPSEAESDSPSLLSSPENDRQSDAMVVQRAFASRKVPTMLDKQGAQLFAVALLVMSRTWISDRIASLNGTSVKYVLEQDKAAFIRLTFISVLQSAASSFVAPSLSLGSGGKLTSIPAIRRTNFNSNYSEDKLNFNSSYPENKRNFNSSYPEDNLLGPTVLGSRGKLTSTPAARRTNFNSGYSADKLNFNFSYPEDNLLGPTVYLDDMDLDLISPIHRHLTAKLALGWRIRLTEHLLKNYLRQNAFYQGYIQVQPAAPHQE